MSARLVAPPSDSVRIAWWLFVFLSGFVNAACYLAKINQHIDLSEFFAKVGWMYVPFYLAHFLGTFNAPTRLRFDLFLLLLVGLNFLVLVMTFPDLYGIRGLE